MNTDDTLDTQDVEDPIEDSIEDPIEVVPEDEESSEREGGKQRQGQRWLSQVHFGA